MKINFNISDFNISGEDIPEIVADKILKWHIQPMQRVRNIFNKPIWASQNSGYRSVQWEKDHNRPGTSQHCFKGKGAVDWTCRKFPSNKDELLQLIIDETDYTRIAVYDSFIHCDYKPTTSGKREQYNSKWEFIKYV